MKFAKLLSEKIIVKEGDCYKCICGSVLKENSVHSHMKTKKHLKKIHNEQYITPSEPYECGICYLDKSNFYRCQICKNIHCLDCHSNMVKCPFCRKEFPQISSTSNSQSSSSQNSQPLSNENVYLNLTRLIRSLLRF